MLRSSTLLLAGALTLLSMSAAPASAASLPVCGATAATNATTAQNSQKKRQTKQSRARARRQANAAAAPAETVKATLTLNDKDPQAVPEAAFGRSKDPQQLTLIYGIGGCRPPKPPGTFPNALRIGPVKGSPTIPYGVVRLDGQPEIDGQRLILRLTVYTHDSEVGAQDVPAFTLKPGTYSGFVRIGASWMHTAATPITVSRSESRRWVPILWGLMGAALGFGAFAFTRVLHDDRLQVHGLILFVAGAVSIGIGVGTAYFTNYLNQDVWTMDANGFAAATAAFTASTTGWAAGMLAGIWTQGQPLNLKMPGRRGTATNGTTETNEATEANETKEGPEKPETPGIA